MTRNQLLKKKKKNNCKTHKHVEAKQHATNQPMVRWRNERTNKKYLETKEKKITMIQNLWDTTKAFLGGKVIVIQAYLGKKKKLKQPSLTPKGTREWRTKKKHIKKIRAEINRD